MDDNKGGCTMSFKHSVFGKITAAALTAVLLCSGLPLSPVSAVTENTLTAKEVKAYLYGMDQSKNLPCLFSSELPDIPFMDPVNYLNCLYMDEVCTQTKNTDGTYTIANKTGSFVVDPQKDTLHFDSIEQFQKQTAYDKGAQLAFEYCQISDMTVEGETHPVDLDLGAYHIDIVEKDGKVYLPLPVMSTCFSVIYNIAEYIDGTIYFAHNGNEPFYSRDALYDDRERDAAIVEFAYNDLCFMMDYFYGAPAKGAAADSVKEKGFDATLDTFSDDTRLAKELLHSHNMLDYQMGLATLYNAFEDGGHTDFTMGLRVIASTYGDTAVGKAFSEVKANPTSYPKYQTALMALQKYSQQVQPYAAMISLRNEAYLDYDVVLEWGDVQLLQKDDMAVFVFNKFYNNIINPLQESLAYAAENGIKKFVFDLTANTGGSMYLSAYLVMLMNMKNTHSSTDFIRLKNTVSDNVYRFIGQFDMNFDGVYDEKDNEVIYDFDFAVLTSHLSYSSGNNMPCMAQEKGIPIFGETSGGGTCVVSPFTLPDGGCFTASCSTMQISADNRHFDDGAPLAYDMITSADNPDYHELYDLAHLDQLITDYYNGTLKPAPVKKVTSSVPNTWMIVGICGAIVFIGACVIVAIVIIQRKKKKPSGT